VIKNDDETIDESNASMRATSVESKTNIAHRLSSHPREQSKTHDCLNSHIVIEPITSFLDCSTTLDIVLPQNRDERTVHEGDYEAAVTINLSSVIVATSSSFERESQRDLAQNEEKKWEIVKIVDKRWTRRGCEYMMR